MSSIEIINKNFTGYRPLLLLCLPLADLHHFCLTKQFPITSPSEQHLHFALIRLCLALLFIISIHMEFVAGFEGVVLKPLSTWTIR